MGLNFRENNKTFAAVAVLSRSPKVRDIFAIILIASLVLVFMWRAVFLRLAMEPIDNLYELEPWKSEYQNSPLITAQIWNPDMTDEIMQGYPQYTSVLESLKNNSSILWDPSILTGMPAFARGNLESNPVFLALSSILPLPDALNWTRTLGLFLAGLFTFLFLRELGSGQFGALIAGLAFSFNAYLISWLSLTFFFSAMIWLPLIFWGIERAYRRNDWRWALAGGLGFTLQILSGSILFSFFSAVTLLLFYCYRSISEWIATRTPRKAFQPLFQALLALVFGALLAAPQLLLVIELYLHSRRDAPIGAGSFLDPWTQLIRLIAPRIYGDNIHGHLYQSQFNFPETNLYLGIIPLFFIAFSLKGSQRKAAWGLLVIGLFTLLAVYSAPVRQIVRIFYPFMLNTFPGRIFFIVVFCLSVTAGLGADALSRQPHHHLLRISALSAALLLLLIFNIRLHPDLFLKGEVIYPEYLQLPMIYLGVAALLFFIWGLYKKSHGGLKAVVLIFLIADLFIPGINDNAAFDRSLLYPQTESLQFLQRAASGSKDPIRLLPINSEIVLPGNTSEAYALQTITGYSSWILERYSEYTSIAEGRYNSLNKISFYNCCDRLLDALGASYIFTSAGILPDSAGILNLHTEPGKIESRSDIQNAVSSVFWDFKGKTEAVLFESPPSKITYSLQASDGMRFVSDIFVEEVDSNEPQSGMIFRITIARNDRAPAEVVFQQSILPNIQSAVPYSLPVIVNLSPYDGEQIHLSLEAVRDAGKGASSSLAGWINPRIEGYSTSSLEEIYSGANKIYRNTKAFPRAWIVHHIVKVPIGDIQSVKKYLRNPEYNLRTKAVVEDEVTSIEVERFAPITDDPSEEANIIEYASGRVLLEIKLVKPGMLVFSDMMYPGWKAYVDGVRQPVLPTNLIMRGVVLDAGKHQVLFTYAPDLLWLGLFISVLTVLIACGFFYRSFKRIRVDHLNDLEK